MNRTDQRDQQQQLDRQRAIDSTWAVAAARRDASLSLTEARHLDDIVQRLRLKLAYPIAKSRIVMAHQATVDTALAEAGRALTLGQGRDPQRAAQQLALATSPLTATQTDRRRMLQRKLNSLQDSVNAIAQEGARIAYAGEYERKLLDENMDVTVTAAGSQHTTLRIRYVLINRVWVYKIQHSQDLLTAWRTLGFKKIDLGDGYNQSWTLEFN